MNTTRNRLARIADTMWIVACILVAIMLGLQIYIFNEYRQDVRENRRLLCASKALHNEEFCVKMRASDYDVN